MYKSESKDFKKRKNPISRINSFVILYAFTNGTLERSCKGTKAKF